MSTKKKTLLGLITVGLLTGGCSGGMSFVRHSRPSHPGLEGNAKHYLADKGKGPLPNYDVPIVMNDKVKQWLAFFQNDNQGRFNTYLCRSGRYEDFMRHILAEEGVPQDLIYLALIESGFSHRATSRAKAVGFWQFIRSTGKLYGLKQNNWLDERKDPEKATRAAAQYLKRLHNEFGDWYLAMAAYNAGEGRIRSAIQRSGSHDFWEISKPGTRFLKNETKDYVPKFIAAALIAKNPARFGFRHVDYEEPMAYDTVRVKGRLDLGIAAALASTPTEEMCKLNPELKTGITPHGTYALRVPAGKTEEFKQGLAKLPPEARVRITTHRVKRDESLVKIAKRYGVSKESIVEANDLSAKQSKHLRAGTKLVIPQNYAGGKIEGLLAYNTKGKRKHVNGVEWLIKKDIGDGEDSGLRDRDSGPTTEESEEVKSDAASPDVVLNKKGINNSALPAVEEKDLGGTASAEEVRPAEPVAAKQFHVIRRGDNLWNIAKHYGVTVANLKKWNKMSNTKSLKAGKSLIVSSQ